MDDWTRVFRVVANSLAFFFLIVAATSIFTSNPALGILLGLAAFDQLKDVYRLTTGRRLLPEYLRPLDAAFEVVMLVFSLGVFIFSLIYYAYFATWFFRVLMIVSVLIAWSSVEELLGIGGEEREEEVRAPAFVARKR